MLHQTISNIQRKMQSNNQHTNIVSPQRSLIPSSLASLNNIHMRAPHVHQNQSIVCDTRKPNNKPGNNNPTFIKQTNYQAPKEFNRTGIPHIKKNIQTFNKEPITIRSAQNSLVLEQHQKPSFASMDDIEEETIICGMNITQKTTQNLNEQQSFLKGKDNTQILLDLNFHGEIQNKNKSSILLHQFKNTLQKVQRSKSPQTSQIQSSINPEVVQTQKLQMQNSQKYIVQLLSEAEKTKAIIKKLIKDNELLISQNKKIKVQINNLSSTKKLFQRVEVQNLQLKQQVVLLEEKNKEFLESSPCQKDQALTIILLQKQIQMLKSIIQKDNSLKQQEFNLVLRAKEQQIAYLQTENQELSFKIKQMLKELQTFQSRFHSHQTSISASKNIVPTTQQQPHNHHASPPTKINNQSQIIQKIQDDQYIQNIRQMPGVSAQSPKLNEDIYERSNDSIKYRRIVLKPEHNATVFRHGVSIQTFQ